jgi:hypothetical protein
MKIAAWLLSRREELNPEEGGGSAAAPEDWRQALPEHYEVEGKDDKGQPVKTKVSLRSAKTFEKFKDVAGVARGYLELERKAGDGVKIPGADAKPEERRAFYDKLGVPKDASGYDINVPKLEGASIREETLAKAKAIALKHGVATAALQELTNTVLEDMAGSRDQMVKAWQDSHEETIEKEWGANLKPNAERARRTFEQFFGGKEGDVAKLLVATGLEHHPGILKGFYEISKHFREHPYISGEVVGEIGAKEAEARRSQIRTELSKDGIADRDRSRLQAELERLLQAQYGTG